MLNDHHKHEDTSVLPVWLASTLNGDFATMQLATVTIL